MPTYKTYSSSKRVYYGFDHLPKKNKKGKKLKCWEATNLKK